MGLKKKASCFAEYIGSVKKYVVPAAKNLFAKAKAAGEKVLAAVRDSSAGADKPSNEKLGAATLVEDAEELIDEQACPLSSGGGAAQRWGCPPAMWHCRV